MAKRMNLTDAGVARHARPLTGRVELKDVERGLVMRITPHGVRSWSVVYRLADPTDPTGKRTLKKRALVGRHPAVCVADARDKARQITELARQGIDPEAKAADDRVAQVEADAERQAGSFGAVAAAYVAAMKAGQLVGGRKRPVTLTTAVARERLFRDRVLAKLGDHPLNAVTTRMVAGLLSEIEKAGGPVDETLKLIRGVFKFALARGLFHGAVPTTGMTNRQVPTKETRALSDDELRAIWAAAGRQGGYFGLVVRLLMLTGQRKMEIAGLRWGDIDWDRKLLLIPAERVKNRKGAHEVALTDAALALLNEALEAYQALTRGDDRRNSPLPSALVFPSDTGKTPISGWNKLKANLDRKVRGNLAGVTVVEWRAVRAGGAVTAQTRQLKGAAQAKIDSLTIQPWRIHDLRHTFITRCRDGDENSDGEIVWSAPLDVLQATVNHEITAGVTAAYDHGDIQRRYRLRKRELMEWWNRKLMMIVGEQGQQA